MSNIFIRNFKKTKIRVFLFFLFIAIIFWVLTKFSREYTAAVEAQIDYTSIPENVTLSPQNKRTISFEVTANGFDFLIYQFNKPHISVSVLKYYDEGKTKLYISKDELIGMIATQLTKSLSVQNLSVNELTIYLDKLISKKVPVQLKSDLGFKNGFKVIDSIRIKPDSITISGPSEVIKNTKMVETKVFALQDIDKSFSSKAKILKYEDKALTYSPDEVLVSVMVDEFSQQEVTVPIIVINLPPSKSIKIIPQNITVTFDVSLKNFSDILDKSFRVVCDFNERNSDENFMTPKLVQQPKEIRNAELSSKKIDFLLFK